MLNQYLTVSFRCFKNCGSCRCYINNCREVVYIYFLVTYKWENVSVICTMHEVFLKYTVQDSLV